jgi:AcrR family transcriptional regulator
MVSSRLLDVAIREFGERGLAGASTRGIASAAGTAMSSITYHYGGKEGLYAAAVAHIDADMAEQLDALLGPDVAPQSPAAAREAIHRLLDHLLLKFLLDEDAERSLFIMREQMRPSAAFDRFFDGTMGRVAVRLVTLVRTATGATMADARLAAVSLFGQVVVWRASRALADRLIETPIAGCADAIRQHLSRNTDCILDRLRADQQEPQ